MSATKPYVDKVPTAEDNRFTAHCLECDKLTWSELVDLLFKVRESRAALVMKMINTAALYTQPEEETP